MHRKKIILTVVQNAHEKQKQWTDRVGRKETDVNALSAMTVILGRNTFHRTQDRSHIASTVH